MENYQYLNQKTEISNNNQIKLNYPYNNKNIQIQNFFRGDSNVIKPKIYNINSKKEIHFSSRPRDIDFGINGPKILTNNFPPEFIISSNNSRKNSSHEKNLYFQKNLVNNAELNNLDKSGGVKFSNTVNKEFEKLNNLKNNNKKNQHKLILINLNKKNNFQNKAGFYTNANEADSAPTGLVSNKEYMHSETEFNKKRKNSKNGKDIEKENGKNEKYALNHIKTEASDFPIYKQNQNGTVIKNNYKSNLNKNINKPLNSHNYNRKKYKTESNFDNDSNSYINTFNNNLDNSRNGIFNNYMKAQKNIFIVTNSNNKLVFNPSNINPRMKKINSESEYNSLYLINKNSKSNTNNYIKYYNNINELNKNNGKNNYYKSESLSKFSSSHDKYSHSHSRDKHHIKTQTDFDTRPNYYESIINELEHKRKKGQMMNKNINSAVEYNKNILENFSIKKKIENINISIAYKINNGYKFYFNLPNEQIFIFKEVSYSCGKGLIPQIELWNKKNINDSLYLKIYDHEINFNQRQIIWIMQYPTGGESINDIINSVGFYDQNILFDLVTKIYKAIIKLNEEKDYEKYRNVPFCICDIFINVNEHIKIIPPLIRQIPIDANVDKKHNNSNYISNNNISQCKCRDNLNQILENLSEEFYSFFCLGFAIMQTITQNLIFDISSYKYILNLIKTSKKKVFQEYCCFVHLLLTIEKKYFNNSKYLLFSNFLNLYPKSLLTLLHECTNFDINIPSSSNEFLNLYDTNKNLNLSIKEILDITTIPENDFIKLDTFLSDFEILFKDIKINPNIFLKKLNSNKVIHVLSRAFGLDKEQLKNKIREKIGEEFFDINNNNNNNSNKNESENVFDVDEKDFSNEENGNKFNLNNNKLSSLLIGFNPKNKNKKDFDDNTLNK